MSVRQENDNFYIEYLSSLESLFTHGSYNYTLGCEQCIYCAS